MERLHCHRVPEAAPARLLVSGLALLLTALLSGPGFAHQDPGGEPNPDQIIERYLSYLAKRPHDDRAFEKLMEVVTEEARSTGFETRLRRAVESAPDDPATRVVLARLLARSARLNEAVAQLTPISDPDYGVCFLLGEIETRRQNLSSARDWFDRAQAQAQDARWKERIHRKQAEVLVGLGDREGAVAAYRRIVSVTPRSFPLRIEVSALLARAGFLEASADELRGALELAGADTARRCQALSELGTIERRRGRVPEAIQVVKEALALTGRGNWRRPGLEQSLLELHTLEGTASEFVSELEARVREQPTDLALRELLARALLLQARHTEAVEVLRGAVAAAPGDRIASQAFREALAADDDSAGLIRELERGLGEWPDDTELRIELGRRLLAAGRVEAGREQWRQVMASNADPALVHRLATIAAEEKDLDTALLFFEEALRRDPRDVGTVAALLGLLQKNGRLDEIEPHLEAVTMAVADRGDLLEEVARLWEEAGDRTRARDVLLRSVQGPDVPLRRWAYLADLEIELKDYPAARQTLHRLIDTSEDPNVERSSVNRLAELYLRRPPARPLVVLEEGELESGTDDPAPYRVLARFYERELEITRAARTLERLLEKHPDLHSARADLARLYRQLRRDELALTQYRRLVVSDSGRRRQYLNALVDLHFERGETRKATEALDEILAHTPENPGILLEVARRFERLGQRDRALQCLRQAIRLTPDDGVLRLAVARHLATTYMREPADPVATIEAFRAAIRRARGDTARETRRLYYEFLNLCQRLPVEIEWLRSELAARPTDIDMALALASLHLAQGRDREAAALVESQLRWFPGEGRLRDFHVTVLLKSGRRADAARELVALLADNPAAHQEAAIELVELLLDARDLEGAREIAAHIRDRRLVAQRYEERFFRDDALTAYEEVLERDPDDLDIVAKLAPLYEATGRDHEAARAQERLLETEPDKWQRVEALGTTYGRLGAKEDSLRMGGRLLELLATLPSPQGNSANDLTPYRVFAYFIRNDIQKHFSEAVLPSLLEKPQQSDLLNLVLHQYCRDGRVAQAIELLRWTEHLTARSGRRGVLEKSRRVIEQSSDREVSALDRRILETPQLADAERLLSILATLDPERAIDRVRFLPDDAAFAASPVVESWRLQALIHQQAHDEAITRAREWLSRQDPEPRLLPEVLAFRLVLLRHELPSALRESATESQIARVELLLRGTLEPSNPLAQRPGGDAIRFQLGSALLLVGGDSVAAGRTVLASIPARSFPDLGRIGRTLEEAGETAASLEIRRKLIPMEAELSVDPVLRQLRSWRAVAGPVLSELADQLRNDEPEVAYDLLRRYGEWNQAAALLERPRTRMALSRRYREASERLRQDPGDAPGLTEALVYRAEILARTNEPDSRDEELAVYRELIERHLDVPSFRRILARRLIDLRAIPEASTVLLRSIVDNKSATPALSTLMLHVSVSSPTPPSRRSRRRRPPTSIPPNVPVDAVLTLFRLHLEHDLPREAVTAYRTLRSHGIPLRWLPDELAQQLKPISEDQTLQKTEWLPFFQILNDLAPRNALIGSYTMAYLRALGRDEEAEGVRQRTLGSSSGRRARRPARRTRSRMPSTESNALQLAQQARKNLREGKDAEALTKALEARALAPSHARVLEVLASAQRSTGDRVGLQETLEKLLDVTTSDSIRVVATVDLAELHRAEGRPEISLRVLDAGSKKLPSSSLVDLVTMATSKGLETEALQVAARCLTRPDFPASDRRELVARLAQVELERNDPVAALDLWYVELERSATFVDSWHGAERLIFALTLLPEVDRAIIEGAVAGKPALQADLYRAAVEVARGEAGNLESLLGPHLPTSIHLRPILASAACTRCDYPVVVGHVEPLDQSGATDGRISPRSGPFQGLDREMGFRAEWARSLDRAGRHPEAQAIWLELEGVRDDPRHAFALARLYSAEGHHDAALRYLESLPAETQSQAHEHDRISLANAQALAGDRERTLRTLDLMVQSAPPTSLRSLSNAYRRWDALPHFFDKLGDAAPGDPMLRMQVAMELGRGAEADAILRELADQESWPAIFALARRETLAGHPDEARQLLEGALVAPKLPEHFVRRAHENLAELDHRLGRVDEALDHWKSALTIGYDPAERHLRMAGHLVGVGRGEAAAEEVEEALRLDPQGALDPALRVVERYGDPSRAYSLFIELARSQGSLFDVMGSRSRYLRLQSRTEVALFDVGAPTSNADSSFRAGLHRLYTESPTAAVAFLEQSVEQQPTSAAPRKALLTVLRLLGRTEEAVEHLDHLDLGKQRFELLHAWGQRPRLRDAIGELDEPTRSHEYLRWGFAEEALPGLFRQAVATGDPVPYAMALFQLGEITRAREILWREVRAQGRRRSLARFESRSWLDRWPAASRTTAPSALLAILQGPEELRELLAEIERIPSPPYLPNLIALREMLYRKLDRGAALLEDIVRRSRVQPSQRFGYLRARLLVWLERYEEAATDLEQYCRQLAGDEIRSSQSTRVNRPNPELAALFAKLGRREEFEAMVERLRIANGPEGLYDVAKECVHLSLTEEAMSLLERAVELDPSLSLRSLELQARLRRVVGPKDSRQQIQDRLLVAYESQLAENPGDVSLLRRRLTYRILEEGRAGDPEPDARTIVELFPDDPRSHVDLGFAHLVRSDAAAASTCFERADELLTPRDRQAHPSLDFGLGFALTALGERDAGRSHLRRALVVNPSSHHAPRAKKILSELEP